MIFFICPFFQIITRHFYYGIFLTNTENGQLIKKNSVDIKFITHDTSEILCTIIAIVEVINVTSIGLICLELLFIFPYFVKHKSQIYLSVSSCFYA